MDIETAKAMLQLLLGKHWPLYAQFAQFLEQSKYKVINKDQWCNILEFSRTISNDLNNYDVDGACKYLPKRWAKCEQTVVAQIRCFQILKFLKSSPAKAGARSVLQSSTIC